MTALEQPQEEVAGKRRQHRFKLQLKCKAIKTAGMFILIAHTIQNHKMHYGLTSVPGLEVFKPLKYKFLRFPAVHIYLRI